ncbi:MAG: TIGR02453 family protein [Rhodocyclales bacterium RIFCSPLOWO2_02_FULL_63_24]|nr:MAG: TIGR02453 family protein [Rhodocyclales bacterium RIFCSPLOWO2_02_FULL_63_24]
MFSKATLSFLDELAANNERAWFEANKPRYEALVREPALEFIAAMAPVLAKFAPHFRAEPRKMGGSLMRVFRDTRFSRDKTPYKTNIGIQFRHELGKDVHAPGFYVHVATDGCFFGAGCWHPEADALGRIRDLVAAKPERWFAARDDRKFAAHWALAGDSLSRPPRGYAADHRAIEDLKRKDFIGLAPLSDVEVTTPGLVKLAGARFAAAAPLMKFLCDAQGVQY